MTPSPGGPSSGVFLCPVTAHALSPPAPCAVAYPHSADGVGSGASGLCSGRMAQVVDSAEGVEPAALPPGDGFRKMAP